MVRSHRSQTKFWLWGLALFALGFVFYRALMPWGMQKVRFSPAKQECFVGGTDVPWKACFFTAPQGTNGGLAYFLHGIRLDENYFNKDVGYGAMIQKIWEEKWQTEHVKPPLVASVSFGPVWLLTPKGPHHANGLLDIFTQEIMPEVEKRVGAPRYRIVFGESMGGLNSLELAFKTQSLFNKVAAMCPPLYRESPFSPLSTFTAYLKRTGADPKILLAIRKLVKNYVATDAEWEDISPVALVEKPLPSRMPEIYLSGNLYDRYGNYEGAEYLAQRLAARGVKLHWHPLFGNHCAVDPTSVAEFLIN